MGFLDQLSKTFTSGVDRAKFEADKFQRTSRISGEVNNIKSQVDTNIRQLGERALELYQQGTITAPEVGSLAQIIAQLRDQLALKEAELNTAQNETFEAWQAGQPQTSDAPAQSVPISDADDTTVASAPSWAGRTYDAPESTDMSGSGLPNTSSVGGQPAVGDTPYACPNCGYSLPNNAAFCPNCGNRMERV
jgi:BMFP domain-containing protein YqiC